MFFLDWLLVFLGVLYLYLGRNNSYWKRKGVPFLEPRPFIGNLKSLLCLKECPGTFVAKMYELEPDEPYVGFFMFDRPALLLRDPELIKQVLVTDFRHFTDRFVSSDELVDPLGAKNVFLAKGQRWRMLRTRLTAAFTSGKLRKAFPAAGGRAEELRDHIADFAAARRSVDVKEATARSSTDAVCACLFGVESRTLGNPRAEFRTHGKRVFSFSPARAIEVLSLFFAPAARRLRRCMFFQEDSDRFFRKVFRETITSREASGGHRDDLVDVLVRMKQDLSSSEGSRFTPFASFSDEDAVAQAAIFFTAGFETTSITTAFALYELAANPAVQRRLRAEIGSALRQHGGELRYEAVRDMTYLSMVLAETLRLYPPLPFLDRICVEDYTIPGSDVIVEKNIPVYVPVLGLHRDPKLFPDPLCFLPERFEPGGRLAAQQFAYLPFGAGPRLCIGKRFGEMSAKLDLIHILSYFEVQPCEDTPTQLTLSPYTLFLRNKGKIPLAFKQMALP